MNDVRPFEEYKEMIKDMRKEEMIKGLYDLSKNITEKDKEIERLNNIINKLEETIEYEIDKSKFEDDYDRADSLEYCLATLQELKGSDKNES